MTQTLLLSSGWLFAELPPGGALPALQDLKTQVLFPASVPGTIHQDLLALGQIPDPFFGRNEELVSGVSDKDYLYYLKFRIPEEFCSQDLLLCFDGLDTCVTIYLNEKEIARSDNMFVPLMVDITDRVERGDNHLVLHFVSAARIAKEREAASRKMRVWNGDASRVYVRKAQYHWGWDWGPTLLCTGPYKPISLLSYAARLTDLFCSVDLADDLQTAKVTLQAEVQRGRGAGKTPLAVRFEVYPPGGGAILHSALAEVTEQKDGQLAHSEVILSKPALWWPAGQGDQPLYEVGATLVSLAGEVFDRENRKIGIRRITLCQEPIEPPEGGTSFHFEVNGRAIFCQGANWIPADSFLPRVTDEKYRALLTSAKDAGLVMMRVWGGGIYENDVFYDLCDELGLLVWQDFMFACGLYPSEPWFCQSVQEEAQVQIRRLRNHPSLALYCGNNEDYSLATSVGTYPEGPDFPAKVIYEELLADICKREDPTRPYWPGSPFTPSHGDPNDPQIGDRHTWDIWHGQMADYQDYERFAGRFVSEFGMQAFPVKKTVRTFTLDTQREPDQEILHFHNKAEGGPERLRSYVERNLGTPTDLEGQIYATQLVQAEALAAAYGSFRRRFLGRGKRLISGALVWQWNDCWPGITWSVVDYYLRPKASFYAIRRQCAALTVGLAWAKTGGVFLFAGNATQEPVEGEIQVQGYLLSGALVYSATHKAHLPKGQSSELGVIPQSAAHTGKEPVVFGARLRVGGAIFARATLWPQPLRDLSLPDPGLRIRRTSEHTLQLTVERPAKGVLLSAQGEVVFSDNLLDLLPDDPQEIQARGLQEGTAALRTRYLGQEGV